MKRFCLKYSLALVMLGLCPATGFAQSDNRYCAPGDISQFPSSDGPAALPASCIYTAMAATPSPGVRRSVSTDRELQTALQSAQCGDSILLQSGSTFAPFTLPAKNCDAHHWITIRTSASDADLPAEGVRLTPCYGGSKSLPARPPYPCATPANKLAKVELKDGTGAISIADGANHYRLIGLEVTRRPETGIVYALIRMGDGVDHIIIDRCYVHGTPLDETTRGINLGGSSFVAVIDSYFSDFHCLARTGACTDSQTINGGNTHTPVHTYKIVNNYLEAAAENIMFGGGSGSEIPGDIEVRRNFLFKPLMWLNTQPGFIGKEFIAKNLFELKNAQRVLVEGNVMDGSWGGYTQVGYGIVLTPRGSWAAVQDVTIRFNLIRHTGSGILLAASRSDDDSDSLAAQRWSVHDDVIDDLDPPTYHGDGVVFQIASAMRKNLPLNHVSVDHITVNASGPLRNLLLVGAAAENPRVPFDIAFTNNIVPAGKYSVWSNGVGTCAKSGDPATTFLHCWQNNRVSNNVIINYPADQKPWSAGNFLIPDARELGFATTSSADVTNLRLSATSALKGKASDNRDPGADVDMVISAIKGVQ